MKILIALPIYNEEVLIKKNIIKIFDFCQQRLNNYQWQIVIVDNASNDNTQDIAKNLVKRHKKIDYVRLDQKGKGLAIKYAWQNYLSDIYCFMDLDLSTDLGALPPLIKNVEIGYDLVIGSRYLPESKIQRDFLRKIFSKTLNFILRFVFNLKIKDFPCGFKAVNKKIVENILPKTQNLTWFFDLELIILADKMGSRIKEIPVIWSDKEDEKRKSRVNIFKVGWEYLKEIYKLRKRI